MNYVTAAKQFDEAIAVLATAPIDEVDINDIPPSPEPYRLPFSSSVSCLTSLQKGECSLGSSFFSSGTSESGDSPSMVGFFLAEMNI